MNTTVVILLAAAVAAIAVALAFYYRRKRTEQLHNRFGPEYERAVTQLGDRQEAESELEGRTKRVKQFHIHAISAEERRRFADAGRPGAIRRRAGTSRCRGPRAGKRTNASAGISGQHRVPAERG